MFLFHAIIFTFIWALDLFFQIPCLASKVVSARIMLDYLSQYYIMRTITELAQKMHF